MRLSNKLRSLKDEAGLRIMMQCNFILDLIKITSNVLFKRSQFITNISGSDSKYDKLVLGGYINFILELRQCSLNTGECRRRSVSQ